VPANAAGLPLSPEKLIMDLRDHMMDRERGNCRDVPLIGGVIKGETLGRARPVAPAWLAPCGCGAEHAVAGFALVHDLPVCLDRRLCRDVHRRRPLAAVSQALSDGAPAMPENSSSNRASRAKG